MLHQILQQFEFLVRQIDGPAVQRCRVAVGIHHEIAGTDLAILGALRIDRGAGARDRRIAAFRHQSQAPLHIGDAPLRVDDGEPALGEDQHDRRGQTGSVNQPAQRLRRGEVIPGVEEEHGVLRHLHQACGVHRQHAHAVGQQCK